MGAAPSQRKRRALQKQGGEQQCPEKLGGLYFIPGCQRERLPPPALSEDVMARVCKGDPKADVVQSVLQFKIQRTWLTSDTAVSATRMDWGVQAPSGGAGWEHVGFDDDDGLFHLLSLSDEQQFGAATFLCCPRTGGEKRGRQAVQGPRGDPQAGQWVLFARRPSLGAALSCARAPEQQESYFADIFEEGSCSLAEAVSYC